MEFLKKSKVTEYEVNGIVTRFKGIPLKTIFKIRNLAEANKSISKLLAHFFTDKTKDAEVISSQELADADKALYNTHTRVAAIDTQLATIRQRELESGIAGIQSLITSPESQELFAEIIYYSVADQWKNDQGKILNQEEAIEYIKGFNVAVSMELLIGAFKASSGVVKVLGKLFPQIPKNMVDLAEGKIKDLG